jgi:hypothetical protein
MSANKISLHYPNLIATEGVDAKYFLIHYLTFLINENSISDNLFQVEDYGGITDLPLFLAQFDNSQLKNLKNIIIIRDAETNAKGAKQSVFNSLKNLDVEIPSHCLLFPAFDENTNGTLENLCLNILSNTNREDFLEISNSAVSSADKVKKLSRIHKNKLHTYLSLQDKYVGLKIGESAKSGAFDFNAPELTPLKELLQKLSAENKENDKTPVTA